MAVILTGLNCLKVQESLRAELSGLNQATTMGFRV